MTRWVIMNQTSYYLTTEWNFNTRSVENALLYSDIDAAISTRDYAFPGMTVVRVIFKPIEMGVER